MALSSGDHLLNNARPPLLALCALLVIGALYALKGGEDEPFKELNASHLPFPIEEEQPIDQASEPVRSADRTAGVVVDTPYGAWLGVEFAYEAEFRSTLEVNTGETKQVIEHVLSGRQLIRMVDRTHEGFVAAYSWPDLELRLIEGGVEAPAEKVQALRQELARPVLVYYDDKDDPNGVQQALRFTAGTTVNGRSWARTLVACQRGVLSRESAEGFDLVEADSAGRHRARYQVLEQREDFARVSREKLESLDRLMWAESASPPELSGSGVVEFSEGWFSRVEWSERSSLSVEAAKLEIKQRLTADVERRSIGAFEGDGLDGWELEEEWRSFDGNTESAAALSDASEELDADLLQGADVGALVDKLVSLELSDSSTAEALLVAERLALLIEEDPAVLETLAVELSSGVLSDGAARRILGAIATAGTPEAQETLRDLFLSPNPPEGLRDAAALALFQLPSVTPETINTFDAVLSDEEASVELRSASWLLLGAFATTGSDPALTDRLISMEAKARETGELVPWLEALGNTRSPAVLEAATRHLNAADPDTRVSAVRALRHIETPDATQALVNRAAQDEDSYVRKEAITLLAGRGQQGVLNTIGELLQGEPLASVRRAALDAIADRPMDEELLALLSDVVSSDPDSSLRSYALELLGR